MGNAIVSSAVIVLKERGPGVWGSVPIINTGWSVFNTVVGENTLTAPVNNGKTVVWDKPTLFGDGSPITNGIITGYKIYKKDTEELYSVATMWSTGQSGLSDSVPKTPWKDSLPLPNATNTFNALDSLISINNYIQAMSPGDVLYLSDSEGDFNLSGNNGLINVPTNGTEQNYITIMAVPGQNPKMNGTHDGTGTAPTTETNQAIIHVTGDFVRLYGLELYRSKRYGMRLEGNAPIIEENYIHECYSSSIIAGYNGNNSNGVIKYNIIERSLTFPGVTFRYADSETFNVDGWTLERNISFRNGYDINNVNVDPFGSGDGFSISKSYHSSFDPRVTAPTRDGNLEGRWNAARNFLFTQNLAYYNSDDGFDESVGQSLFISNISMNNGDKGSRGFKTFTNDYGHFERVNYVGNVSILQNPNGGPTSSSVGYEQQSNFDSLSGPTPTKDSIANTALHNDNGTGGTVRGIFTESNPSGKAYNNLSHDNSDRFTGTFDFQNNYLAVEPINPDITDYSYNLIDENFIGPYGTYSVEQIWRHKYRQVMSKIMPLREGNLYNSAVQTNEYYPVNSADNPVSPSDPDDKSKLRWFSLDKTSPKPDIGASQFEYIQPPLNVSLV